MDAAEPVAELKAIARPVAVWVGTVDPKVTRLALRKPSREETEVCWRCGGRELRRVTPGASGWRVESL